jgi:tetratricopeptide (TPR) repeat protein
MQETKITLRPWLRTICVLSGVMAMLSGCGSSKQEKAGFSGVTAYYQHHYLIAEETLRAGANDRKSGDVVLNNMRLGMAALAEGDANEAERSLTHAYEYLTSGGVNAADRTITSTLFFEGAKVWKGEPYEQAMSFYYVAALYMLRGDWENARAAANNSLFSLKDFEAAGDKEKPDAYKAVESDFALGYLLVAINYVLMGTPHDADRIFDHVAQLRPDLADLVAALRTGGYDTLLLVDLGRGPVKRSYGEDNARVRFEPDGRRFPVPQVSVSVDSAATQHAGHQAVVDLWSLAQRPKWWSAETARVFRSTAGSVLAVGGLGTAGVGAASGNRDVALAGLGIALAGAALKGSSAADTRHLETLPHSTYIVPLTLGPDAHSVRVQFDREPAASGTWHDITGGTGKAPRVYYLRMHAAGGQGMPAWSGNRLYSADVPTYRSGDKPWIMGGGDLTPPSQPLLDAYHAGGVLVDKSLEDLRDLYHAEGIVFTPGSKVRDSDKAAGDDRRQRHIVDGGRVLFEFRPGSHGYEHVTHTVHGAYQPRGEALRSIIGSGGGQATPAPPNP